MAATRCQKKLIRGWNIDADTNGSRSAAALPGPPALRGIGSDRVIGCGLERWDPGIGDPTAMGWVTVAVYTVAAILAALVVVQAPFPARSRGRERAFWTVAALTLAFLAVNKELDLQSLLTAMARCAAQAQGWYDERHAVQLEFIMALAAASGIAFVVLLWLLRGTWRRSFVPALGLAFVTGFVLVRAAGFHHVDRLIGMTLPGTGFRANWALELPGPLLVAATAIVLLSREGPGRQEQSAKCSSRPGRHA
jgi:hypothetical protein